MVLFTTRLPYPSRSLRHMRPWKVFRPPICGRIPEDFAGGGIIVLEDHRGRKILIIDGHSLAHRAYYALPATLTRADGMPTNAVLGFCNMVAKMLEEGDFDAGVCAFDTPSPTFRHEQFEDYKATRKPMDDSLKAQMPVVREAAEAFGFTLAELDGWEADDVIGTIARMAEEAGGDEAIIVTGDKDALQLVSDNVRVVLTRRGAYRSLIITARMRSGSGTALTPSTFLISRD